MAQAEDAVRADKWLWAARLVKTRALAVEAINGGRVWINGQRVKPSRPMRVGDQVDITTGVVRRSVIVQQLSGRRGPPAQAALLFEETPESIEHRERQAEERRLSAPRIEPRAGRPTKRDRRRYDAGRG